MSKSDMLSNIEEDESMHEEMTKSLILDQQQ